MTEDEVMARELVRLIEKQNDVNERLAKTSEAIAKHTQALNDHFIKHDTKVCTKLDHLSTWSWRLVLILIAVIVGLKVMGVPLGGG